MAIAEAVGKDRRGQPIFKRDEDGEEILEPHDKKSLVMLSDGRTKVVSKRVMKKIPDDDLPSIAIAYAKFLKGKKK